MIQILGGAGKSLFLGDQKDEENIRLNDKPEEWAIVHACKEPYHRKALGYTGRSAPKEHPEYLFAYRDQKNYEGPPLVVEGEPHIENRLILNLVDVEDSAYVRAEIIDEALRFIHYHAHILVHCNQGASRSPTIVLLYQSSIGRLPIIFELAEQEFRKLYPPYCPGRGMRGFASANWDRYRRFWDPKRRTESGESTQ